MTDDRQVHQALVAEIRGGLPEFAQPMLARRRRAMFKGDLPFYGIRLDQLRWYLRDTFNQPEHALHRRADWEATITELWQSATYREERHAAIGLSLHPPYREWTTAPASMSLYRTMICTGRSADLVDPIAAINVGLVLQAHPDTEEYLIRSWAMQRDPWLRRAAILSQYRSGSATNRTLLLQCISLNVEDRTPVLRHAIGHTLRRYGGSSLDAMTWVLDTAEWLGSRLPEVTRRVAQLDSGHRSAVPQTAGL